MWLKKIFFTLFILPHFVVPKYGSIYEYNPNNFKKQIEQMDGNFVMFYAPWCSHCTDFHPIWHELAVLVNNPYSKFAIAQVDCTLHQKLCNELDITGYPTLLYFHKNSLQSVEYKGTRDLISLTVFLSEIFTIKEEGIESSKNSEEVKIFSGVSYLNDYNIEKFLSKGQHFVMFYKSWSKSSQQLAPIWAELGVHYAHNEYIKIGKVNCMESPITCDNFDVKEYPYLMWIVNGKPMGSTKDYVNLNELKGYVDRMMLAENHDPEKFMKKKKALPVARITEETFEAFFDKEIVFINFFAPWCGHCMQLSPLWSALGEQFLNESRVLIADVDCASSKAICATEKISGLPTLVLYKNKKIVNKEHGSKSLASLVSMVQDELDNKDRADDYDPNSDEERDQNSDDELEMLPLKDEL